MNDYGFEQRSTQVKKSCIVLAVLVMLTICTAVILCARSGHTVLGYILFGAGGVFEVVSLSVLLHYLSKYGIGENETGYSRLLHGFLIHCVFTLAALYCVNSINVRYTLFLSFADGALGAALVLFAAVFFPHANKCSRAWWAFVVGSICVLLSFFGLYMALCLVFLILAVLIVAVAIVSAKKAINAGARRGLVISCLLLGLLLAAGSVMWLLIGSYSPILHMSIHTLMLLYCMVIVPYVRCAVRSEYRRYIMDSSENAGPDGTARATDRLHRADDAGTLADSAEQVDDGTISPEAYAAPSGSADLMISTSEAAQDAADSDNAVRKATVVATVAATAGAYKSVAASEGNTLLNCNLALKPQFRGHALHLLPDMPVSILNGMSHEQEAALDHMGVFSIADLAALPSVRHAQHIAEMAKREE